MMKLTEQRSLATASNRSGESQAALLPVTPAVQGTEEVKPAVHVPEVDGP